MVPQASIALAVLSAVFVLSGIIVACVASSASGDLAKDQEAAFLASRSQYVMSQLSASVACTDGADGCDGSCSGIDLSSSVPTFAYFKFYNITNPDVVIAGGIPNLAEVGPYTCLTHPPVMTARITRTTSDDVTASSMAFTQEMNCDAVTGGDDLVYLFDKSDAAVKAHAAKDWIAILKGEILSSGDTVGTGGAPEFSSYAAHGNASIPNNYMRRVSDDAPVLPIFPHARLADGDAWLTPSITVDSVLQWHLSSIGQTVAFTWKHHLYVKDPLTDHFWYARFATLLPAADLTSRSSDLFDKAYSYHKCRSVSFSFEPVSSYPACAAPPPGTTYTRKEELGDFAFNHLSTLLEESGEIARSADALSPDDFFIDVDLLLGIPSGTLDVNAAGGWQAYEIFPDFASPNCTGSYGDAGLSAFLWAWGYWSGNYPYVSHDEYGYTPSLIGAQGKWLAEFGVTRPEGVLPAFAFSMMPKMIPLLSPTAIGATFPFFIMGQEFESRVLAGQHIGTDAITYELLGEFLWGKGIYYLSIQYTVGTYYMYLYCGIYLIVYGIVVTMGTAIYRFKADQAE